MPEGMNSVTVHNWPLKVTVTFPDTLSVEAFEKIRTAMAGIVKELEPIQTEAGNKIRGESKTGDGV